MCNHPDLFEPRPINASLGQPRLILDMPALVISVRATYGAMHLPSELGTFLWWDVHSPLFGSSCWGLCPASFEAAIPPSETQSSHLGTLLKGTDVHPIFANLEHSSSIYIPCCFYFFFLSNATSHKYCGHMLNPPFLHATDEKKLKSDEEQKELNLSKQLISALKALHMRLLADARERMKCLDSVNRRRCSLPLLSCHPTNWRLIETCKRLGCASASASTCNHSRLAQNRRKGWEECEPKGVTQLEEIWVGWSSEITSVAKMFCFFVPHAIAPCPALSVNSIVLHLPDVNPTVTQFSDPVARTTHVVYIQQKISFPDRSLVRYDGGKLQTLCVLLAQLKQGNHKALIFTQMFKMLDILEVFLNAAGHTYVRLDGSTGVERRQCLMDRK